MKRNNDTAGRSYSRGKLRNSNALRSAVLIHQATAEKKVRVKIVAAADHLNFKDIEARHGFRSKGVPNEKYNNGEAIVIEHQPAAHTDGELPPVHFEVAT